MAYCMSRSGTPLIKPAVQKVRRSACGLAVVLTPARRTALVSRRAAAPRFISSPALERRMGPSVPVGSSGRDGAQHGDRQRDVGGLAALAEDVQHLGLARLADAQAEHAEERNERVRGVAVPARGGQPGGQLQWVQDGPALALPLDLRSGDRYQRRSLR